MRHGRRCASAEAGLGSPHPCRCSDCRNDRTPSGASQRGRLGHRRGRGALHCLNVEEQARPEELNGPRSEGFGSAQAAAELAGRLREGEVVGKAQQQHLAVGRWQARQRQPQFLAIGQNVKGRLPLVIAVVGQERRTERDGAAVTPPHIDSEVVSETEELGGKRHSAAFTIGGAFEEADKDIVLGIADKVGVAEALQQIVVEARAVGCVDPAQHVGVAAADTGDQVGGWGR